MHSFPSYSPSLPACSLSRLNYLSFSFRCRFSSFVSGSGSFCKDQLSSSAIAMRVAGEKPHPLSFPAFSWAMASPICSERVFTLSNSLARFLTVVLRHTNVYLLVLDSIFVPSIYSTSRVIKPFSANMTTGSVNTRLISSFTRLQKRLMILKSGCS